MWGSSPRLHKKDGEEGGKKAVFGGTGVVPLQGRRLKGPQSHLYAWEGICNQWPDALPCPLRTGQEKVGQNLRMRDNNDGGHTPRACCASHIRSSRSPQSNALRPQHHVWCQLQTEDFPKITQPVISREGLGHYSACPQNMHSEL